MDKKSSYLLRNRSTVKDNIKSGMSIENCKEMMNVSLYIYRNYFEFLHHLFILNKWVVFYPLSAIFQPYIYFEEIFKPLNKEIWQKNKLRHEISQSTLISLLFYISKFKWFFSIAPIAKWNEIIKIQLVHIAL